MVTFDLRLGNSVNLLKELPNESVDLVITSPPYDNIKNYNNSNSWNFDVFKQIANELYRVIKTGGVIIWVVADQTIKGSESGTSFRQALYFHEIGFNIHDTMIYRKENYVPLTHNRYEQEFEYMFCFSKDKPKTFNPIRVPCKYAGAESWGNVSFYKNDSDYLVSSGKKVIGETKIKGNIFSYRVGSTTESSDYSHPAMFPIELVKDQVISWSNKGDTILDPFMGSGTTGVVCIENGRNFIGFEIENKYFEMSQDRIKKAYDKQRVIDSKAILW